MTKEQTSAQYFKTLTILFAALLMGQVLFACVAYYLVSSGSFVSQATELEPIFTIMVPVLILGGVTAGQLLFKNRIKSIESTAALPVKLGAYRASLILRYALAEGPCLFAIIGYLLTGSATILAMAMAAIIFFITLRPSKEKLVSQVELSSAEIGLLNDPNSVVA